MAESPAYSPAPPSILFFALLALGAACRDTLGNFADLFFHLARLRERRMPIRAHRNALVAIQSFGPVEQIEYGLALLARVADVAALRDRLELAA